jgi:hypothetical protein
MKSLLALCVTLAFAGAGFAGHADAAAARKHKKQLSARHHKTTDYSPRTEGERYRSDLTPDWYPHDSSVLPFGSRLWWQQREREGGGDRN